MRVQLVRSNLCQTHPFFFKAQSARRPREVQMIEYVMPNAAVLDTFAFDAEEVDQEMSDWFFAKIRENVAYPLVVMFQSGKFRTPVAILHVFDLVAAVREYGQEPFLKELARIDKEARAMKK